MRVRCRQSPSLIRVSFAPKAGIKAGCATKGLSLFALKVLYLSGQVKTRLVLKVLSLSRARENMKIRRLALEMIFDPAEGRIICLKRHQAI